MKKYYLFFACILFYSLSLFSQVDEGFEGVFPPSGWQLANGGSIYDWEQNTSYGGYGLSSNSASFNNHPGSQPTNTWYVMRCPSMTLTGSSTPTLEFDVAYARYSDTQKDLLRLFYSLNGISGWTVFKTYSPEAIATAPDTTSEFTPTNAQWQTISVDLSQFNNENFIRFAFEVNPDPDGGNIMYIDNVKFADIVLSTNSDYQITDFNLYPNPSTGSININTQIKDLNSNKIEVINTLGQRITDFDIHERSYGYELNLNQLPKGTYFVSIESDGQKTSKMIFLQ
ncbi:MAG: choice-of-anchor J domain-containing protein [Flavobacteriaceae bacterium]